MHASMSEAMTSTDSSAQELGDANVTVLVRCGNRCRPITKPGGSDERELRVNIRNVLEDMLSPGQQFFLQIKDDDWGGEFIDVPDGMKVADRSVFRLLLEEEVLLSIKCVIMSTR